MLLVHCILVTYLAIKPSITKKYAIRFYFKLNCEKKNSLKIKLKVFKNSTIITHNKIYKGEQRCSYSKNVTLFSFIDT
jgi:hypothetical protein